MAQLLPCGSTKESQHRRVEEAIAVFHPAPGSNNRRVWELGLCLSSPQKAADYTHACGRSTDTVGKKAEQNKACSKLPCQAKNSTMQAGEHVNRKSQPKSSGGSRTR